MLIKNVTITTFTLITMLVLLKQGNSLLPGHLQIVKAETVVEQVDEDAQAAELAELEEKIREYEKKIEKLKQTEQSLQKEIDQANSQIALAQLRIEQSLVQIRQKESEIERLIDDIDDLGLRIDKLSDSIDYQENLLEERMRARYKSGETSTLLILFGSETMGQLIQKAEYIKAMERQDKRLLAEMAETKNAFGIQKTLFEDKKEKEETLKAQLERERSNLEAHRGNLNSQKQGKERLLQQTQNDEAKFQELLKEAIEQANSFKNFASSAGGGVIDANGFGKGELGWYFSQRDSRWAQTKIGTSNWIMQEVGCLITSVAMVHKSYGSNATPASFATNSSYYVSGTAMMWIPWPAPSGTKHTAINKASIDSELNKGNPVIVGIYAGPYGTHFVVLSEKVDNDYIMYDPYYGPDLKFGSMYSTNSIFQAVVFK